MKISKKQLNRLIQEEILRDLIREVSDGMKVDDISLKFGSSSSSSSSSSGGKGRKMPRMRKTRSVGHPMRRFNMPGVDEGLEIRKDVLKNSEVKAAFEAMIAQKTPEAQIAKLRKIAEKAEPGTKELSSFSGLLVRMIEIFTELPKYPKLKELASKDEVIYNAYMSEYKAQGRGLVRMS